MRNANSSPSEPPVEPTKAFSKGGAPSFALFLDLDGTLVDIADMPSHVSVPPNLVSDLASLRERLGGALAVVTGRSIAIVDQILGIETLDIAGVHGAEIRLGGIMIASVAGDGGGIGRVRAQMQRLALLDKGCVLEDKGQAVALHWRLAPNLESVVLNHVLEAAAELGCSYRLQRGKSVVEILPTRAAKSAAILELLRMPPYAGRTPVFIGDDLTDEPAFEAINLAGGISIRVGGGRTAARYGVSDPAEVQRLIRGWANGAPFDLLPSQTRMGP